MSQFLWYDCNFKKQCTVPVTLTFDLWKSMFFQRIDNDPISVLYEFQIDISTNSWEIKYQFCICNETDHDAKKYSNICEKFSFWKRNPKSVWMKQYLTVLCTN